VDGGNTWSFLPHPLQGQISDLYFVGQVGWAASSRVRAVMWTTDAGGSWGMPAGAVISRIWLNKLTAQGIVRGSTIAINPFNKNTLYTVLAAYVYRSRDEGETWSYVSTIPTPPPGPPTYSTDRCNAFIVSAKDSNYWVAAVETPDRIVWTDDA